MKKLAFVFILSAATVMAACGGSGGGNSSGQAKAGSATAVDVGNPNGTPAPNAPVLSNSVDPLGRCTPQFISDYDEVVLNGDLIKNGDGFEENEKIAKEVIKSCEKFSAHHLPTATCTGHITYNGIALMSPVSSSTVTTLCEQVRANFKGQKSVAAGSRKKLPKKSGKTPHGKPVNPPAT